jgi:hypothetical protein
VVAETSALVRSGRSPCISSVASGHIQHHPTRHGPDPGTGGCCRHTRTAAGSWAGNLPSTDDPPGKDEWDWKDWASAEL